MTTINTERLVAALEERRQGRRPERQRLPLADQRGALLVMATGTGKTRTGMDLFGAAVTKGHRGLWLAHTDELISQPLATFGAFL